MEFRKSQVSCGVFQLVHLDTDERWEHLAIENSLKEAFHSYIDFNPYVPSQVIFSDAVKYKNGRKLAKLITTKKWGKVVKVGPVVNPGTLNKIETWLWQPNKKFNVWMNKE